LKDYIRTESHKSGVVYNIMKKLPKLDI